MSGLIREKSGRQKAVISVMAAGIALAICVLLPNQASAQGGWWPWAQPDQPPPRQREPVYRNPGPQPVPAPIPSPSPYAGGGGGGGKSQICLQLEQKLVQEGQRGNVSREQLPRIETDLRQSERVAQQAQSQLERSDCYDFFLFSKTLRRTRQCVDLANQADGAKRRVAELDVQRQQILGTRDRSYLDDIYRELARNGCGADYAREANKRQSNPFSSLWQDEDTNSAGRGNEFGALPYATYRTICVRLCDGYFFPVSFSTLKNHFDRDVEACQSKCAAPAELYYYQNPGGSVDQAVAVKNQTPYTGLKTAFRYRKEYVQGCSCKQAEYTPSPTDRGDRKAETPPAQSPTATPASAARQALR